VVGAGVQRERWDLGEPHLQRRLPPWSRNHRAERRPPPADAAARAGDTGRASESGSRSRAGPAGSAEARPAFRQPSIRPDLVGIEGASAGASQEIQRPAVIGLGSNLGIKPGNGFEVVVEHIRPRAQKRFRGPRHRPGSPGSAPRFPPPAAAADLADGGRKVGGAAVRQVIAGDGRGPPRISGPCVRRLRRRDPVRPDRAARAARGSPSKKRQLRVQRSPMMRNVAVRWE